EQSIARAPGIDGFEAQRDFAQAYIHHAKGEAALAAALLRGRLANHQTRSVGSFMQHLPQVAAALAEHALAEGIEPDFVRSLIVRRRLRAPDDNSSHWPRALAVRCFGKLELLREGVTVLERGKTQQKPQALLAVLAAAGDKGVERKRLMAQLWSEGEVAT